MQKFEFPSAPAARAIIMPAAPACARLPAPRGDDDEATHHVLEAIARLHLAAFITLHGPAPDAVACELVRHGKLGQLRPSVMTRLEGPSCEAARRWMRCAAAGLDSWAQAGWADPILRRPGPLGLDCWWTAPIGEAASDAAMRLRAHGRRAELRNLVAHLGDLLPDAFDPDCRSGGRLQLALPPH